LGKAKTDEQKPVKNRGQLVVQDSGKSTWITPPVITGAARLAMGSINLDVASSVYANGFVGAEHIYTIADNGLTQPWFGNVWVNWPYSVTNNRLWSKRLVKAYQTGEIVQACCIGFASTSEGWFKTLSTYPYLTLNARVPFINPDTGLPVTQPLKGSVVFYLGPNLLDFYLAYQHLGRLNISPEAPAENVEQFFYQIYPIQRTLHP